MNRERENDRDIARENKNDLVVFDEMSDDEKDEKEKEKKEDRTDVSTNFLWWIAKRTQQIVKLLMTRKKELQKTKKKRIEQMLRQTSWFEL